MATKQPVFERLVGLETEYAIRYQEGQTAPGVRPTRFELYQRLIHALQRKLPVVPARHFKDGVFTATGGAVWFETERPAAGSGLIEGATPECRGPREVLRYQRAQDRLVSEAAAEADSAVPFTLLKNDRDAFDNVYGAQENYEVTLASGWRLGMWRAGMLLLIPLALLTWIGFLLLTGLMVVYLILAGMFYVLLQPLLRQPQRLALALFGEDFVHGRDMGCITPRWLESVVQVATRVLTMPLAVGLWGLAWCCAFVPQRRDMLAFLISRALLSGAGMVDRQGQFLLADKAPAMNCVLGYGGLFGDRPILTLGHFFKALSADAWFSPTEFRDVMRPRQRLQIGLGDSNMAEVAEYLRVGTTLLVLDALEAGALHDAPRLRRPLAALQTICRDTTLTAQLRLVDGTRMTALDLQRRYLDACRSYLNQQSDVPHDAWHVLRLWDETLEQLEEAAADPQSGAALLGRIDWVTKRYLLQQAGESADWASRKKIDIRYHELSSEGYYQLLADNGLTSTIVEDEEIERSLRLPPANTPATMRGHYIREFSQGDQSLAVNWKTVLIGQGRHARLIRLSDYRPPDGPGGRRHAKA